MQVVDFMPAFLHCLSSQNYVAKSRAIDVNQRFLVIESNFCLYYYFEEHPLIFIKLFITYNFTALY